LSSQIKFLKHSFATLRHDKTFRKFTAGYIKVFETVFETYKSGDLHLHLLFFITTPKAMIKEAINRWIEFLGKATHSFGKYKNMNKIIAPNRNHGMVSYIGKLSW